MFLKDLIQKIRFFIYEFPILFKTFFYSFHKIHFIKNWPIFLLDATSCLGFVKVIKNNYITYELKNNIKYKIRASSADNLVIWEVNLLRQYDRKGFEIKETDTIVDIGAHIGIFSVWAAKFAKKGKVYSFEPFQENFQLLKHNIELNNIKNIETFNLAIAKKEGKMNLFISTNTGGHSIYNLPGHTKEIGIQTITLDKIIDQKNIKNIDFLKMDCEGAEYDILFNCKDKTLSTIKKISMEYHNIDEKFNIKALKNFLESKNFIVEFKPGFSGVGMLYAKKDEQIK